MGLSSFIRVAAIVAVSVLPVCGAEAQFSSNTIMSSPLKVETTTTVPGASLKPGSYKLRVIDNLKDRYIFAIEDGRDKDVATFIGMLQHSLLPGQGAPGPVLWANAPGKTNALRGFAFPNGQAFEFVYPKATAVELAKINASSVPAIDPESEGMPVDSKLSPEDRKVVTLWLLTSTRVGPGKGIPAIEARRAQPASTNEVAQVWNPPTVPRSTQVTASTPAQKEVASSTDPSSGPRNQSRTRQVAAKLPQTASDLPLVVLVSGLLLFAGLVVGLRSRAATAV